MVEPVDSGARSRQVRPGQSAQQLPNLFEQLSTIGVQDEEHTRQLRRRYLALILDSLRPDAAARRLEGPPPSDAELVERWVTS